jgi:hypothetical protein
VIRFAAKTLRNAALTTLFTAGVWCGGLILEALILARSFGTRLLSKYPLFYSYLTVVFASDVSRMAIHRWQPRIYDDFYWITQFIALVFGAALMFEIYRSGLALFPGAARIARNILFLIFALLLAKSIAIASPGGIWVWLLQTPIDLERDLRIVQAFSLLALVGLFLVYAIPVDRNLKGIVIGYGIFVASGVVQLALVSRWGPVAQSLWSYAQPFSYLMVLGIWVHALWSYAPSAAATGIAAPPVPYDEVSSATRRRFRKAFTEIVKGVRP